MQSSMALAVAASLLHLCTYGMYSRRVLEGGVQPNRATWSIWAIIVLLNTSSYFVMTGDWVKSLLPVANGAACLLTAIVVLSRGRNARVQLEDKLALLVGSVAALIWGTVATAAVANLVLQVASALAFLPTYRGVLADPRREAPAPWLMWAVAYALSATVVGMRWTGRYEELVYPVLSAFWHTGVALLSLRRVEGLDVEQAKPAA